MLGDLLLEVARHGVLAFAAVIFVAQMLAREVGLWLGRRRSASDKGEVEGVGVVVGGMLGLLAFVLALTLSFSNARFQERRDGTMTEANAIGTAWLRAQAIDHPRAAELARLLETYAPVRRDFVVAPLDDAAIAALQARTDALQAEMWGQVAAIVREQPNPITAHLMAAVNDVIDQSGIERLAFATTLPRSLLWLLLGLAAASMAAVGYQFGLRGARVRALSIALVLMWTVVLTLILDLGSARLGDVRTSPAPYDWVIESFAQGVRIPPPPAGR